MTVLCWRRIQWMDSVENAETSSSIDLSIHRIPEAGMDEICYFASNLEPDAVKRNSSRRNILYKNGVRALMNRWQGGSWKSVDQIYQVKAEKLNRTIEVNLDKGGRIRIFPSFLSPHECQEISNELKTCGYFRKYRIQGGYEPRVHFLLHEDASEDFQNSQPGYRYGTTRMKALPISKLPLVEEFSDKVKRATRIKKWGIGVNPVFYRGGNDRIGFHSDNDQDEECIFSAIIASPTKLRRVLVRRTRKEEKRCNGDEYIELLLGLGDAYEMDGEMQAFYEHAVPADNGELDNMERIAIVFRAGRQKYFGIDTGEPVMDLSPRKKIPIVFGSKIKGLVEGRVYTRVALVALNAHRCPQKGVSGNCQDGCDSVVVSGKGDCISPDYFIKLAYTAKIRVGALALLRSYAHRKPVRVFRSSVYQSPFRAIADPDPSKCYTPAVYRYDGLYNVVRYLQPVDLKTGVYAFELQRSKEGENLNVMNRLSTRRFIEKCKETGTMNSVPSGLFRASKFDPGHSRLEVLSSSGMAIMFDNFKG